MNKTQSKYLSKCISDLEQMKDELETMRESFQESYDGKSDKWQESDKGEELNERITNVQSAIEYIESAIDDITNVRGFDY